MSHVQALPGVEVPIVRAPVTCIAHAPPAAAVSEAGGLGHPTVRVLRNGLSEGIAAGETSVRLLGRITEVRPVADIVREMWDGARAALDAGRARLDPGEV